MKNKCKVFFVKEFPIDRITSDGAEGWYTMPTHTRTRFRFFDAILEPLAVEMDFWNWANAHIPIQNFVAWFFVSMVLLIVFYRMPFPKQNRLAAPVMIIQFLFFTILHVMKF